MDELSVPPLAALRCRTSAKWTMHDPDVLPMSIAEMDFELAEPIREALDEAIRSSDVGYAQQGITAEPFARFALDTWGWRVEPNQTTAVTDVGVGVVEVLRLLDVTRVMVSSPVYPPFFDWVREARAELVDVPLAMAAGRQRLDLEQLEAAFHGGGTYLLCNPQNPSGTAHTKDELSELLALARQWGITIISDEIHAPLALPGVSVVPLLSIPGAAEVAIAITSATKAWNLAGLKCAIVVTGSHRMSDVVDGLPPDTRWRVGHLGAIATVAAFDRGREWRDRLLYTLDRRRERLEVLLREQLPSLEWAPPEATYLAWLDCSALGSGLEVADRILSRARVALEPGERFGVGGTGYVRLNFATSADNLEAAVAKIASAL